MGPFPHDAPPAEISKENPAGTDGFEFVEFAHPEPEKLEELFEKMGYRPVAKHRTKNITENDLRQVDPELISFFNINTPQDLAKAEEMIAENRGQRTGVR